MSYPLPLPQSRARRLVARAAQYITWMLNSQRPNGIWSGDEHLNGTSPTSGTELCAVVEYLCSLEEMLRIIGDPDLGDRLEWVAYNALPAAFSADMWAHQWDRSLVQPVLRLPLLYSRYSAAKKEQERRIIKKTEE
jgi:hypothetical protein